MGIRIRMEYYFLSKIHLKLSGPLFSLVKRGGGQNGLASALTFVDRQSYSYSGNPSRYRAMGSHWGFPRLIGTLHMYAQKHTVCVLITFLLYTELGNCDEKRYVNTYLSRSYPHSIDHLHVGAAQR